VLAFSLAACGGGTSSTNSSTNSATAVSSTATGSPPTEQRSQPLGRDIIRSQSSHPTKAHSIGQEPDDEVNSSGAKKQNPCMLVSRSEAQTILGKHVGEPVEAPQGPTCIYQPQGSKSLITLAVDSTEFSTTKPQAQLQDRMSVTVRGHAAFCGVSGGPRLIIPLSVGKFLDVAAPCPVAAAFAAKALGRLAG
jgi:hypothetical protein